MTDKPVHTFLGKVLLAFDMFVCAVIWRDSGITISSMVGLAMRKGDPVWWARVLNWLLNAVEKGHCEMAIADDILRAQAAIAILTEKEPW